MLHKIVAVYDSTAQAYLKPIFVQSDGAAVRSFEDAVNDPSTEFSKHPDDYSIQSLGEFDDSNATFILHQNPDVLAKAAALVKSVE
jgi:hypothetical protein